MNQKLDGYLKGLVAGEMLKFLVVCCVAALGVAGVLGLPMDMEAAATTTRPEATTEDTSGRLLSLPDPEKCANSKYYLLVDTKRSDV